MEGYKPYGCWHCPIACGGKMAQKSGKFALELNEGIGHKPEYETLAMFGSNLLNDDLPSIVKINELPTTMVSTHTWAPPSAMPSNVLKTA